MAEAVGALTDDDEMKREGKIDKAMGRPRTSSTRRRRSCKGRLSVAGQVEPDGPRIRGPSGVRRGGPHAEGHLDRLLQGVGFGRIDGPGDLALPLRHVDRAGLVEHVGLGTFHGPLIQRLRLVVRHVSAYPLHVEGTLPAVGSRSARRGYSRRMARPVWSGTISFGLVNVPVKAHTAVRDHDVHFHQLQKKTGSRIRYQKVAEKSGKEVEGDDIEMGFEVAKGRYVTFDKDEPRRAPPRVDGRSTSPTSSRWRTSIRSTSSGRTGSSTVTSATRPTTSCWRRWRSASAGIGTVVMRNKQYLTAVRPLNGALAMSTMRFADEVVPAQGHRGHPAQGQTRGQELRMATQLLTAMTSDWDSRRYHDTFTEELRERIEAKDRGEDIVEEAAAPEPTGKVVDLMAALEASVDAAKGGSRRRTKRRKSAWHQGPDDGGRDTSAAGGRRRSGWTRRRHGRGFVYLDEHGRRLAAAEVARCKSLAIPPAWRDVWICSVPNGHLQAVGTDEAGRRQYLYHPEWRRKATAKHDRMLEVAARLPAARATVAEHLALPEMPKERALATAFRLLDLGLFRGRRVLRRGERQLRAGDDREASRGCPRRPDRFEYQSAGPTPLRRDHRPAGAPARGCCAGAAGGGPQLLAYRQGRTWHDVTS